MFWWLDPDWDALRRDLDAIAGLGADHVRVFGLWPVLQPNRAYIRPAPLADLRRLVQEAAARGLDTSVDVLQGHLSSFDFLPSWVTTWHRRNMFTDPSVVEAERDLVRAVGAAVADLPTFLGLTLGNEVNQFSGAPHPQPQPATPAEVTAWLETLLDAAGTAAPGKAHLHAAYDAVWYRDDHPFVPAHVSRQGALASLHSWVFNGTAQAYGALSHESVHHARYLLELARAFATGAGTPLWLQEVGAPLNVMTPDEARRFARATIETLSTCPDLWGVTWWCSHDVDRALADFPDLEYSLGLLDVEQNVKPVGRAVAEAMAALRQGWDPTPPDAAPPVTLALPVDADDVPLSRASLAPRGAFFEAWMAAARDAVPAIRLQGPGGVTG